MHDRFAGALAPDAFYSVNGLFRVCASKAHTYAHYNACLADNPSALLWEPVTHWVADTREALVAVTLSALADGTPVVISRGVDQCRTEAAWRGASQARKSDETALPVQ